MSCFCFLVKGMVKSMGKICLGSENFDMKTKEKKKEIFTTGSMMQMALFAALLCVSAYISIPLPLPGGGHLSVINFVVLLIAMLFPLEQSFFIVLIWMLLGALGIPVYAAGSAGIGYILSPLGGYNIGFLLISIFLPLLRKRKRPHFYTFFLAILGMLLIDFIGMVWMKLLGGMSWKTAFLAGFLPFLPLDMVKAVVTAKLLPAFRRIQAEN